MLSVEQYLQKSVASFCATIGASGSKCLGDWSGSLKTITQGFLPSYDKIEQAPAVLAAILFLLD